MKIEALLKALENYKPSKEDKKRLKERLTNLDEEFELRRKKRRITEEFLNRECTI